MKEVYITDLGAFLPGEPIPNDKMADVLGITDRIIKRIQRQVLKSNGIETRHYAIDPETGELTYTNAQMAGEAIKRLKPYDGFQLGDIEALCCGTSIPDQIVPGHASMVHGELPEMGPAYIASFGGVCCASMTALDHAYMLVQTGRTRNAVVTGSENFSASMRSGPLQDFSATDGSREIELNAENQFYTQFLRFMLSDAAGAAFLTAKKPDRPAYRIDWFDLISFAHEMETCMYMGGVKQKDGKIKGWRNYSIDDLQRLNLLALKQDIPLLNELVMEYTIAKPFAAFKEKHGMKADEFDWFLPHYSSHYFRDKTFEKMEQSNFVIPQDKWFTNLYSKGNTGSASIFLIMEELLNSGRLKRGDKILCINPESGRFSSCFIGLTVV